VRPSAIPVASLVLIVSALVTIATPLAQDTKRRWIAGDSHIHSQWSPGYDRAQDPPAYLRGVDAMYPTPVNAQMARKHGLSWMVTTDHGGPTHSKLNRDEAYPELLQSRTQVPEVLQFYGMELNMPAMDHHTLIVPRAEGERDMVFEIESRFDSADAWPADPSRSTAAARQAAMAFVSSLPRLPLIFANHPSRSATAIGTYGSTDPTELRDNNTRAPQVYRGMEGGPGHQASTLARDGSQRRNAEGAPIGFRGGYSRAGAHTIGGFDQMTAIVGGAWDSMLGEGRRFWVVAASDSHVHFDEPTRQGNDFWPGEYHKTYVLARKTYDDVLDGLRNGRVFAVSGDLISELEVTAREGRSTAEIGGALKARPGRPVQLAISFRDPAGPNHGGRTPQVSRVDVIVGDITGTLADPAVDRNPSTRVVARLTAKDWTCRGEVCSMTTTLPGVAHSQYVRVRGTSGTDDEPQMDTAGEDPWAELWFYGSPIFIERGVIKPATVTGATRLSLPGVSHTHGGVTHAHDLGSR
jgi:hypothetical protein